VKGALELDLGPVVAVAGAGDHQPPVVELARLGTGTPGAGVAVAAGRRDHVDEPGHREERPGDAGVDGGGEDVGDHRDGRLDDVAGRGAGPTGEARGGQRRRPGRCAGIGCVDVDDRAARHGGADLGGGELLRAAGGGEQERGQGGGLLHLVPRWWRPVHSGPQGRRHAPPARMEKGHAGRCPTGGYGTRNRLGLAADPVPGVRPADGVSPPPRGTARGEVSEG
jgi:hypothetical protein